MKEKSEESFIDRGIMHAIGVTRHNKNQKASIVVASPCNILRLSEYSVWKGYIDRDII